MHPYVVGFSTIASHATIATYFVRIVARPILYLVLLSLSLATRVEAAERFFISIPGPVLSYVPLYYAQEKGFFAQEGLDLQVLVVRGIIGVSSLMSGEIDVTCHAGSGFSAALRGIPVKLISVTRDRPIHELIVGPSVTSPADLKGKAIAVGSLDGTAAVLTRRVLQAKGLEPQKDVTLLSMDTHARLQSLMTGKVAGGNDDPAFDLFGPGSRLQGFWSRPRLHALPANGCGRLGHAHQAKTRATRTLFARLEPSTEILPGQSRSHASLHSKETRRQRHPTYAPNV